MLNWNFKSARRTTAALLAAAMAGVATPAFADSPAAVDVVTAEDIEAVPTQSLDSFIDHLAAGKVKLNIRGRAEFVDQDGLDNAEAYTIRTRLGYQTKEWSGLSFYVEMEDVSAIDDEQYNMAGLNGQPGKAVVADVEVTELNQLFANYSGDALSAKIGRQVIALDDQRFVGHVGWRQDNQTFDAARVSSSFGVDGLDATYAFLSKINRIFGDERDFDSESHVINISYKVGGAKVTGFAYLLDFDGDAPALGSDTYGIRIAGSAPLSSEEMSVDYQFSYAMQEDAADNPVSYDADYYLADIALKGGSFGAVGVGYEVLGSDDGAVGFATPLATGHKFNGFADKFLATPADGLEDLYVYWAPKLPGGIKGKLAYHYFSGNEDIAKFGQEIDAVASKKLTDNLTLSGKLAYFEGAEAGFTDTTKFTVDLTLAF